MTLASLNPNEQEGLPSWVVAWDLINSNKEPLMSDTKESIELKKAWEGLDKVMSKDTTIKITVAGIDEFKVAMDKASASTSKAVEAMQAFKKINLDFMPVGNDGTLLDDMIKKAATYENATFGGKISHVNLSPKENKPRILTVKEFQGLTEVCMKGNVAPDQICDDDPKWIHPEKEIDYEVKDHKYKFRCIHCKRHWIVSDEVYQNVGEKILIDLLDTVYADKAFKHTTEPCPGPTEQGWASDTIIKSLIKKL